MERVMPVDESLLTGEDVALNRAIMDLGYKLLHVPDVCVWHHRRPTLRKLWRQMYRFAIGRLQLGRRDRRCINWAHIVVGLFIPIASVVLISLYLWKPKTILLPVGLALLGALALSFLAFLRLRLVKVALLYVPLAAATVVLAWSCGFLRELLFPRREAAAR